MKRKQLAVLLLVVAMFLSVMPKATAAPTDTVYVRKHVSLVYDNSGSMKQKQNNIKNLKWTYASYAAQIFAGLLNDMDSLDLTLMNPVRSGNTTVKNLSIDLAGDRQQQVDKLRELTNYAENGTPLDSIQDAEKVLTQKGLLADEQIGDNGINMDEQYWLVLTTDGRFENGNVTKEQLENELEKRLKKYSNLQLVYFGIGAEGDKSGEAAYDLRDSRLTSYPNFTAVYAEKQEQIVATMQSLANRISGRYSVSDGVEFNDAQVTLQVSGESSPIRNIAILAQQTDAKLLSAVDEEGTKLTIARPASEQYPRNTGKSYDNIDEGTKGAYTVLITHPDGKFKPGEVTLTFTEPVNKQDFSLMYEPAVFARLTVEQKDDAGNWVVVPYGQKVRSGQPMRVSYEICEDGTNQPLEAAKLPGVTTEHITCGNQVISKNSEFSAPTGNFNITATVSMMNGSYTVSTMRSMQSIALDDYSFKVSDPLSFYPDELATNTDQHIDFTVLFEGAPATKDQMTDFTVNGGDLKGTIDTLNGGIFRFIPKQDGCAPGEMTVQLCFQGQCVASQIVTVKELIIGYEAKAGDGLTMFNNEVAANTQPITFTVTRTKGVEVGPLPEEESGDFRIEAKSDNGTVLNGVTSFSAGQFSFVATDGNAQPGEYTVTLYRQDVAMASAHISILKYNAQFTAEVFTIGDGDVDLFNLRKNESALAFVIYADGEACTGMQLQSMLGNMIILEHDCPKSIMKLDLSIGTHEGKAAIIARPTSKANTALGAWLKNFGIALNIAFGKLASDPITVDLTVQAEKGTQITGTLNKTFDPKTCTMYIVILGILLVIAVLTIIWIMINLVKPRIYDGNFHYCKLASYGNYYQVQTQWTETRVERGPALTSRPQEMRIPGGLKVRAQASSSFKLRPRTEPDVIMHVEGNVLDSYYYLDSSDEVNALISTLSGTPSENLIPKHEINGVLDCATSLGEGTEPREDAYIYQKPLSSNSIFWHLNKEEASLEIWSYIAKQ